MSPEMVGLFNSRSRRVKYFAHCEVAG